MSLVLHHQAYLSATNGQHFFCYENTRSGKRDWLFVDKNKVININYLGAFVTQTDEVLLEYVHISQINFMHFSAIRKRHHQFMFYF